MSVNFGKTSDMTEAGELVLGAQGMKNETSIGAADRLTKTSEKELESMDIEFLDNLYAEITSGPGNLQKTMSWKKEYFVAALTKIRK